MNENAEAVVNEETTEDVSTTSYSELAKQLWESDETEFGDIPDFNEGDNETDEVNQLSEQVEEQNANGNLEADGQAKTKSEVSNQMRKIKVLGEEKEVTEDEYVAFAQKGADYDRVKGQRDTLRSENDELKKYKTFLEDLKGEDFETVEDLMIDTKARIMSQNDGIDFDEAVKKVKKEFAQKEEPKKAEKTAEELQTEAFNKFFNVYPGIKGEDIPKSVWDEFNSNGYDLIAAYTPYAIQLERNKVTEKEKELETLRQNEKNRNRSTGSGHSSGSQQRKTIIKELWDSEY